MQRAIWIGRAERAYALWIRILDRHPVAVLLAATAIACGTIVVLAFTVA